MLRLLGIAIGAGLLLAGVPLIFTPLPVGLLMVALGTIILTASSPHFARWLERRRARHERLNQALTKAAETLPEPLAEPLERTEPKATGAPIRRRDPREPWRRL